MYNVVRDFGKSKVLLLHIFYFAYIWGNIFYYQFFNKIMYAFRFRRWTFILVIVVTFCYYKIASVICLLKLNVLFSVMHKNGVFIPYFFQKKKTVYILVSNKACSDQKDSSFSCAAYDMHYSLCKAITGTLHTIAHKRCQAFCGICSGNSTFMTLRNARLSYQIISLVPIYTSI